MTALIETVGIGKAYGDFVALQAGRILADRPPAQFFSDPEIIAAVVGKLVGKLAKSA